MLKEQNFAFLYELQGLFGLFARSSDSRANRLFTVSLFTHAPKENVRAGGGGRVSRFYSRIQQSHKNMRKQRAVNSLRPKAIEKYFRMTLRLHCSASLNYKSDCLASASIKENSFFL